MNLKVGDILTNSNKTAELEILGVCGVVVFYKKNGLMVVSMTHILDLERAGWQLKKTEEACECHPRIYGCAFRTKKKTRWVPEWGFKYYYVESGGLITCSPYWKAEDDEFRLATNNIFKTREQAEAYRSELIEKGKV